MLTKDDLAGKEKACESLLISGRQLPSSPRCQKERER